MLSYLSTEHKIRVMEKVLRKLANEDKEIETLDAKKLESRLSKYNKMLKLYETRISQHCKKIVKVSPPSRVNRHVASVVAYSEIRKRLLRMIRKTKRMIKLRESGKPVNRRGIAKYLK